MLSRIHACWPAGQLCYPFDSVSLMIFSQDLIKLYITVFIAHA